MSLSRRLKLPLLLLALLSGFSGFQLALQSLKPEPLTRKDFISEYLVARAVLAGINPYQPLIELDKYFPTGAKQWPPHPTPHTPGLVIFSIPFAFLGYAQAARIWLLAQILCLFASVFLLFRGLKASVRLPLVIIVAWAALGWPPVWQDLIFGQINTALLLLIVGAWLNLRDGREWRGGALLGAAITFKLIFWPIALFLVLRRRWHSAITALAVFTATNLIALIIMGWRVVVNYYTDVGPSTAALYRAYAHNLSLWSVGWRVFSGTGSPALTGAVAPPIFSSLRLAVITSLLLTGVAGALGLAASIKAERYGKAEESMNFDIGYGMMVCLSLLVSPLTWPHYLTLLAFPLAVTARRLRDLRFRRRETLLCAFAVLILLIPTFSLENFISSFSTPTDILPNESGIQSEGQVSGAISLLFLLPTLSVLIILWLMRQLSRLPGEERRQAI